MSVKIILFRRVPAEKFNDLQSLLMELRLVAECHEGYLSGESLMNKDDPEEFLVISTWTDEGQWNEWFQNPDRIEIQEKIDGLLGRKTLYQIYYNG